MIWDVVIFFTVYLLGMGITISWIIEAMRKTGEKRVHMVDLIIILIWPVAWTLAAGMFLYSLFTGR